MKPKPRVFREMTSSVKGKCQADLELRHSRQRGGNTFSTHGHDGGFRLYFRTVRCLVFIPQFSWAEPWWSTVLFLLLLNVLSDGVYSTL